MLLHTNQNGRQVGALMKEDRSIVSKVTEETISSPWYILTCLVT